MCFRHANYSTWCAKGCQFFNLKVPQQVKVPKGEGAIFQLHLPRGVPIFQLFFIFQFLNFSIVLSLCKFLEYLGNFKEKLINLKYLILFSMEHMELTEQLLG